MRPWANKESYEWQWGALISENVSRCNNEDGDLRRTYAITFLHFYFILCSSNA